jgi:hypothetical protein
MAAHRSLPHILQVAAASGPRLAVWSLSGVSARTWLVHSSLVLPDDKRITAVDCSSGAFVSLVLLPSLTLCRSPGGCDPVDIICPYSSHGE